MTTCHPEEPIGTVRQRLEAGALPEAIVVNHHNVFLGQLDAEAVSDHNPSWSPVRS